MSSRWTRRSMTAGDCNRRRNRTPGASARTTPRSRNWATSWPTRPSGILIFRDELVALLATWEKEGREGDRGFYLEGWNGLGSHAIDRIGRGSLFVRTLNLSVFGGSSRTCSLVTCRTSSTRRQRRPDSAVPDACLSRPVAWEWRDRQPAGGHAEAVRDTFLRLATFDPVQDGATPADDFAKVPHFRFDDTALRFHRVVGPT